MRNESFIYGSVDPLMIEMGVPKKDFRPIHDLWRNIPGLVCNKFEYDGMALLCGFDHTRCSEVFD